MTGKAELVSLALVLQPLKPRAEDRPLPLWWGRAAHALLLNTTRQYDPRLAQSLHADAQAAADDEPVENVIRPFTVSNLVGRQRDGALDTGASYTLRLTAFSSALAHILLEAATDGPLAKGATLELDYVPMRVSSVCPGNGAAPAEAPPFTEWTGLGDYQSLSAPYLLAQTAAPRRLALQFSSPTTFKSGGKHLPIPLPELVFGSLLERWNAHAPVRLPPELRRYAAECLAISRYQLNSRRIPLKSGGLRMGGVGVVTYSTINYDRYWMSLVALLADFARYSGVGAGTSMGFGQCRRYT